MPASKFPTTSRPTELYTNEFIDDCALVCDVPSMKLTMTAAIQARWAHRVDGLIHSHAWTVEATVEGPPNADKVIPADDLEQLLRDHVQPWVGHYLTDEDVGPWQTYTPLVWDREPTVEEIVRHLWQGLASRRRRPRRGGPPRVH